MGSSENPPAAHPKIVVGCDDSGAELDTDIEVTELDASELVILGICMVLGGICCCGCCGICGDIGRALLLTSAGMPIDIGS